MFLPIVSGIATVLTVALTYETGKGTIKKIQKRKYKKENTKNRNCVNPGFDDGI